MNGYTYELSEIERLRRLRNTLIEIVGDERATEIILQSADSSNGSTSEFERILINRTRTERIARDVNGIFTDCTCLPLDGGLGAATCDVCGNTEAHAHNPSNIGSREWFAGVDEIEFN